MKRLRGIRLEKQWKEELEAILRNIRWILDHPEHEDRLEEAIVELFDLPPISEILCEWTQYVPESELARFAEMILGDLRLTDNLEKVAVVQNDLQAVLVELSRVWSLTALCNLNTEWGWQTWTRLQQDRKAEKPNEVF